MTVFNPDTLTLELQEENETSCPLNPVKWEIDLSGMKFVPIENYLGIINMKERETE